MTEAELSRLFHRRAVPYNTGKVSIGSRYQYRSLSPSDSNGFSGPHRQPQRSDRIVVPACVAIGVLLALLMILGVV